MRLGGQRGSTLIENMIALAIIMIAATGVLGLGSQGVVQVGSSSHITRATAMAQELLNQIALWDYNDPRLANAMPGNDGDIFDTAGAFQAQAAPPADHTEADLTAGGTTFTGSPATAGYQRYWNVASIGDTNANGVPDGLSIAVIVRWQEGGGWRRVVLAGAKVNPADQAL